jgi:tetrahydromethanopterin S-methyltransferase subunit B
MSIFILMMINSKSSFAFDPYTSMTMVQTASGVLSSMKGLSENFEDLSNFSDLLGIANETMDESVGLADDLGYETDTSTIDHKVEKLEELNSKIKDLKWSKDEMKYALDSDINQAKSLTQKIKQMRKIISVSKKLGGIFGLKTKGSEKVAALQQVKISSSMLDELQSIRKMQLLAYLEDKERIINQDLYLNKLLNEENEKNKFKRKSNASF